VIGKRLACRVAFRVVVTAHRKADYGKALSELDGDVYDPLAEFG